MSYSREERLALGALLDKTGPDAPTLCEGWTTGDLAAHLVLREHRPDAAAGVMGGPAYRITAKNATPAVTVIGSPAELTMWVMGRRTAARVRMDGTQAAVTKLAEANW